MNIVIQSPDAASAASLADTFGKLIAAGKLLLATELPKNPEFVPFVGDIDALARAFTPTVAADTLTFRLNADNSLKLPAIVLPAMAKSREQARRMRSLSNLRQIVVASINYANDHKGEYPPDLQSLLKVSQLTPDVLRNPRTSTGNRLRLPAPPSNHLGGGTGRGIRSLEQAPREHRGRLRRRSRPSHGLSASEKLKRVRKSETRRSKRRFRQHNAPTRYNPPAPSL